MNDLMPLKVAASEFSHVMMSNAAYVNEELPGLDIPSDLCARIQSVCADLIGSKHDLVHELSELEEIERDAEDSVVMERVDRIVRWCMEDIQEMHGLVEEVRSRARTYDQGALVSVLVTESATNILNAFTPVLNAFENLKDGADASPARSL